MLRPTQKYKYLFLSLFLIVIGLSTTVMAQYVPAGIKEGETIPVFSLKDQSGEEKGFSNIKGENGAIIIFNRSAEWCPNCKIQMIDLQNRQKEFEELGYKVAAITYDPVHKLKTFSKRYKVKYPLLSDPNSDIIKKFGILNKNIDKDSDWYGIPDPTIYVIGPEGVIEARFAEKGFRERPPFDLVLERVKKIVYLSNKKF